MNLRKLSSHPSARLDDPLPSPALIARHVQPAQSSGPVPHWFWTERKGIRRHGPDGQALLRWGGRTYNVARVLLQHHTQARVVRAVNACGLPQCVQIAHWTLEPAFLAPVTTTVDLATVRVGEVWRLARGGEVVDRDLVFPGVIAPSPGEPTHVIRALHDTHETLFFTACGVVIDPALVVAGGEASCEACLR